MKVIVIMKKKKKKKTCWNSLVHIKKIDGPCPYGLRFFSFQIFSVAGYGYFQPILYYKILHNIILN